MTSSSSSRRPPPAPTPTGWRSRTGACASSPPTSASATTAARPAGLARCRSVGSGYGNCCARAGSPSSGPGPAKESNDPDKNTKLDRIEEVTRRFPDRCFAFDQFGPLSIRPCHGVTWAPESHPVRLPATYKRTHGIRYFHGCYSLGDDQLWGVTRTRKSGENTLAALKSIRAARPDGAPIYVILDNLSANKTPKIRAWAGNNNVELCFTPTYASWANPIEAQFGPLRTFTMGATNHPNHPALARRIQDYLRWPNAHARHPDVLAAQRRERARVRSERQQRWGRPRAA